MSGLTDTGTGQYTVSFSNNMGNAFYVGHTTGSTNRVGFIDTTTIATSGCTLEYKTTADFTYTDASYSLFSMQGDLA